MEEKVTLAGSSWHDSMRFILFSGTSFRFSDSKSMPKFDGTNMHRISHFYVLYQGDISEIVCKELHSHDCK